MSSTKNTKENRKIVRATYYETFKVPNGVDLQDTEVVEHWWVQYGTLHIKYVGKEEVEKIDPFWNNAEYDRFDFPDDEYITADEYDEEDEEESDDQEEKD